MTRCFCWIIALVNASDLRNYYDLAKLGMCVEYIDSEGWRTLMETRMAPCLSGLRELNACSYRTRAMDSA